MTNARDELLKLANRLEHAVTTMQNDDLSEPMSEKRERHIERGEAMRDAVEYLRAAAHPPAQQPEVEAVAFQYKYESGDDDTWYMLKGGVSPTEFLKQWPDIKFIIRPLYATPPRPPEAGREAALEKAALDFIAKVDRGEARSQSTYAAFKAALAHPSTTCTWPDCDQPSGHDYCYSHCIAERALATKPAQDDVTALDCQEFMPLTLLPLENPNHDPGEHQVLDADTSYVFRIGGSRERAERIVATLNAAFSFSSTHALNASGAIPAPTKLPDEKGTS